MTIEEQVDLWLVEKRGGEGGDRKGRGRGRDKKSCVVGRSGGEAYHDHCPQSRLFRTTIHVITHRRFTKRRLSFDRQVRVLHFYYMKINKVELT